jgi:hypothetical protein
VSFIVRVIPPLRLRQPVLEIAVRLPGVPSPQALARAESASRIGACHEISAALLTDSRRRVCGLVAISRALIAKRLVQVRVEPRQRLKRGPARADQLGRWALARSYRASAHGRSIGTVPSGSYDLWARLRRAPVGPLLGSPRRAPARPPSPALAAAHVVDLGGSLRPWRPPPDCRLTNAQIVVTLDERLGGRDARFCGNSICGAAVAPEELGAVT